MKRFRRDGSTASSQPSRDATNLRHKSGRQLRGVEALERRALLSAAISGTVLRDLTGNGLSADDQPLAGQVVRLYRDVNGNGILNSADGPAIASRTTNAAGAFSFAGLPPHKYLLVDAPVNAVRTAPALSNVIAVNANANTTFGGYVFDNYLKAFNRAVLSNISYTINGVKTVTTLSGAVHQGDTVQANFTVAADASVTLSLVSYEAPGPTFNPATASQQEVFQSQTMVFGPGKHSMSVQVPDCFFQIDFVGGPVIDPFGPAGSNIAYQQEGRLIANANGGTGPCLPSTIGGRIFCDVNLDGAFEANIDEPLGGQTVTVTGQTTSGKSIDLTTTTAADGTYDFANLDEGVYVLTEPEPAGHVDAKVFADVPSANGTATQSGTTDIVSNIHLAMGQNAGGYNFIEVQKGSVSGTVWDDANNNGMIDPLEAGIPGVTIGLAGTNDLGQPISLSTTTSTQGNYTFSNLRPGNYTLTETQPAGFMAGKDIAGTFGGNTSVQDVISNIALPGCDNNGVGYNFGQRAGAQISGVVFVDHNLDLIQEAGEPGLDGVTIKLLNSTDTVIETTTTDSSGDYSFTGLTPGTYTVQEVQPAGYIHEGQVVGTTGGTARDHVITTTLAAGSDSQKNNFAEFLCTDGDDRPSLIQSNFDSGTIPAGDFLWFNSVLKIKGLPQSQPVTIRFVDSSIQLNGNGVNQTVSAPDVTLKIVPGAPSAQTVFNGATDSWVTTVPAAGVSGNIFLDGLAFKSPGLPGAIPDVAWQGIFLSDTPGVSVQWQWSAALYLSNFVSPITGTDVPDYDSLGVKPVDGGNFTLLDSQGNVIASNGDHAGVPENKKATFIGGAARGGGGSNFTGSYSPTGSADPCDG